LVYAIWHIVIPARLWRESRNAANIEC